MDVCSTRLAFINRNLTALCLQFIPQPRISTGFPRQSRERSEQKAIVCETFDKALTLDAVPISYNQNIT